MPSKEDLKDTEFQWLLAQQERANQLAEEIIVRESEGVYGPFKKTMTLQELKGVVDGLRIPSAQSYLDNHKAVAAASPGKSAHSYHSVDESESGYGPITDRYLAKDTEPSWTPVHKNDLELVYARLDRAETGIARAHENLMTTTKVLGDQLRERDETIKDLQAQIDDLWAAINEDEA